MRDTAIDLLDAAIDALAAEDRHGLPDRVLLDRHAQLLRAKRRLDGIGAEDLQIIDRRHATTAECGRSTRGWLVEEQLLSPGEAVSKLRVARAGSTRPAVIEAMRDGEISHSHATAIMSFLLKLDADTREVAERELVKVAKVSDPGTLNRTLREMTDRLCLDETAEERAARQYEGRWLKLTETFQGMTRFEAMRGPVQSAVVRTALTSLSGKNGELDDRHIGKRRADALVELARMAMNAGGLPETAGEPTQCVVATDLEDLRRDLQPGDATRSIVLAATASPGTG
ncbi:MAG TPA: DUF222 domain-containing protein [Mycobacteriales bacterium]|jgi:hypothetical protein|nr:DUF222 domain-containing protein [Mycobacteriales bacterium]